MQTKQATFSMLQTGMYSLGSAIAPRVDFATFCPALLLRACPLIVVLSAMPRKAPRIRHFEGLSELHDLAVGHGCSPESSFVE